MFRVETLCAILIAAASAFCQSKGVFSEPQSLLLFSGELGDLLIASPGGTLAVPHLANSIEERSAPLPALADDGGQVAASFQLPDDPGSAICHPDWPVHGPRKRTIYKSVMGVYSLKNKAWKQYGDFCFVGSAAFSPDGKQVAFEADTRTDDRRFNSPRSLMILDLDTGQIKPVPNTGAVEGNAQISWSRDARYLALTMTSNLRNLRAPSF